MHYTKEQIDIADNIPIMDILREQNEQYKRVGNCYYWKAHDSLRFTGPKWYRFSTREGGQAIRFCERFLSLDFPQAVGYLLDHFAPYASKMEEGNDWGGEQIRNDSINKRISEESKGLFEQKKELIIPEKNESNRHVYAYLVKERGIDPEIVCTFMKYGSVYEEKERNLAVFVGKDTEGNIRSAGLHGVKVNDAKEKWTAKGSDIRYGFGFSGGGEKLYVFEAPIDLMSFISLYRKGWKNQNYVSLSGVSANALEQFLQDHPDVKKVYLCLDNDKAGNDACERIFEELKSGGIEFGRISPTLKDWNEDLLNTIKMRNEGYIWGISPV